MASVYSTETKQTEIQSSIIQVRGKTIIFDSSMFYIPNLSVVSISRIRVNFPKWTFFFLIMGLLLVTYGLDMTSTSNSWSRRGNDGTTELLIGGVLAFLAVLRLFFVYTNEKHGLMLITNSGYLALKVSNNHQFLRDVYTVLYNIMNDDKTEIVNYTFNFDQKKIVEIKDGKDNIVNFGETNASLSTGDLEDDEEEV